MREKGNRLVQYVPDYTVFDLETTGISANMDDIIEISAVKVKGGIVQDTFSTLVNPGRHIPAQATKVNGITDQMVSEAPLIREAMTESQQQKDLKQRQRPQGSNMKTEQIWHLYTA